MKVYQIMNKASNWYNNQSKKLKNFFIGTIIINVLSVVYEIFYIFGYHSFEVFMGRTIGQLIVQLGFNLLVAAVISLVPYFLYKDVDKRYFYYFAPVFLIVTLVLIYVHFTSSYYELLRILSR